MLTCIHSFTYYKKKLCCFTMACVLRHLEDITALLVYSIISDEKELSSMEGFEFAGGSS